MALLLALASGFLFGSCASAADTQGRSLAGGEDGLDDRAWPAGGLAPAMCCSWYRLRYAPCWSLLRLVAVRGLVRSLHSNLGFQPQNALVVSTDLNMAGYHGDQVPVMQRRMLDAVASIPGVASVGLVDYLPLGLGWNDNAIYASNTTDLRQSNSIAEAVNVQRFTLLLPGVGDDTAGGKDIQPAG